MFNSYLINMHMLQNIQVIVMLVGMKPKVKNRTYNKYIGYINIISSKVPDSRNDVSA